jgi:hypothetical protein
MAVDRRHPDGGERLPGALRGGRVEPLTLALRFAGGFEMDRGYGWATRELLLDRRYPANPHALAAAAFDGAGSRGNGAAMRVAPLGAPSSPTTSTKQPTRRKPRRWSRTPIVTPSTAPLP